MLRKGSKQKLADIPVLNDEEAYRSFATELMVDEFGPQCAAWLVKSQKAKFRRDGTIRLVIQTAELEQVKPWFFLALAYLKRRAQWWKVEEKEEVNLKAWYVTWKPKTATA
jgi:hypothetical protein